MRETKFEYTDLGFNGFQVAIKRYKTQGVKKDLLDTKTYHPKYNNLNNQSADEASVTTI